MTYVPPDRDVPDIDQTRQLEVTPGPAAPGTGRPELGNGIDYESAQPVDPYADAPAAGPTEPPEPRKDRVGFQFIWEAILLLLTLNVLFMVYRREEELFGEFAGLSDALDAHALYLTPVLLTALALGLSLRLGAVNLAVPSIAFAVTFAVPVEANVWLYLAYAAGAAVLAGLLYTLLVAAFRVPAWFAGLAVGALVLASLPILGRFGVESMTAPALPDGPYLLGGAALLAVAGGLIGLAPRMRDGFSAVKRLADEEGERSASAVFLLMGGTVLSMLLAAGAGALVFLYELTAAEDGRSLHLGVYGTAPTAVEPLVLAFAVALLAGTSLWGRRGGVFGTVLAAAAVWSGLILWNREVLNAGEDSWQADYSQAIFAGALLLGLFVSFALDRLGRPKEPVEPEDTAYTQELPPFEQNGAGVALFEPDRPDGVR